MLKNATLTDCSTRIWADHLFCTLHLKTPPPSVLQQHQGFLYVDNDGVAKVLRGI